MEQLYEVALTLDVESAYSHLCPAMKHTLAIVSQPQYPC